MRYWVFGFIVAFIPFVTRHTGVGIRQGIGLRITGHHGEFGLFVTVRDQVYLVACVSLKCAEFRECFVVVS